MHFEILVFQVTEQTMSNAAIPDQALMLASANMGFLLLNKSVELAGARKMLQKATCIDFMQSLQSANQLYSNLEGVEKE